MDYLFSKTINGLPKDHVVINMYIVDKRLLYVLTYNTDYFLMDIDGLTIGSCIKKEKDVESFDYYVLKYNLPIKKMVCSVDDQSNIRNVEITTDKGNPDIHKKKSNSDPEYIIYRKNSNKKLF